MVKAPRPGRVKTRLGHDIGMDGAARWYRHQVAALLRHVRDPRWEVVLATDPPRDRLHRRWPTGLRQVPQGGGDLGARMSRALRAGHGPVCLIGSDIPGVRRAHIAEAFALLRQRDAVLGPAPDGGFWLIGLARPHQAPAPLFRGARWSTEHALADTLPTLAPLSYALAATLADVDRARDLTSASEAPCIAR